MRSRGAVAVLDYGAGNLTSVQNALRRLGADFSVTSRSRDLEEAGGAIFPGVGEARASMSVLKETGLDIGLRAFLASGRKVLGICIGCQIIFERSEERDTECLGVLPGGVKRFAPTGGLKVPHMGWNSVHFKTDHPVFAGVPQDSSFYFVHSYYPAPAREDLVAAETEYGITFPSAVADANLIAFQFHLEKSGPLGLRLLSNFLSWDGAWTMRTTVRGTGSA
jgi:glutamine amidotransferase